MNEIIRENVNDWNIENEEKLNEWKQHCIKYSLEHTKNSNHLKRKIKQIMYCTILLSGVASILSGIASYFNHNNVHLVISVSIINGVITSLNLYKNLENFEKSMKLHIESAKGYNEISMKITEQLLIETNERIKYHIFEKNIILQMLSYDNENILLTIDNKHHNPHHIKNDINNDIKNDIKNDITNTNTIQKLDMSDNDIIHTHTKKTQLTKRESEKFGLFLNRFQDDIQCKKHKDIEMNINENTESDGNSSGELNEASINTNTYHNNSFNTNKEKLNNSFDYNDFTNQRYHLYE